MTKRKYTSEKTTWYCSGGHNVFESATYTHENPPECAHCGADMSTDRSGFDGVIGEIEQRYIAEFEQGDEVPY